jgi:DNA-binding protein WhiA
MMELANARIVKDVRNSVNRRNNCDMANISKAVNAASKQIEDILLIDELVGLDALPDNLKEMAEVRMEHPESNFSELGTFLDPQVGKSGVNHRLRKISEFAEDLRNERKTK